MTPSQSQRRRDGNTARKAILYCPGCGHASPINGDWQVERNETAGSEPRTGPTREHTTDSREAVVYRCPECLHVVTTRPGRELAPA